MRCAFLVVIVSAMLSSKALGIEAVAGLAKKDKVAKRLFSRKIKRSLM